LVEVSFVSEPHVERELEGAGDIGGRWIADAAERGFQQVGIEFPMLDVVDIEHLS
jgi:hypothetical protein